MFYFEALAAGKSEKKIQKIFGLIRQAGIMQNIFGIILLGRD